MHAIHRCIFPIRFLGVLGLENRINDTLYWPAIKKTDGIANSTLIYFGGDVQNFTENMETHEDNQKYTSWSLDNTAKILHESFIDSHIIIIRPSRMEYETFSCFKNFVPSLKYGVPDHVTNYHAIHHLRSLLQNLSDKLKSFPSEELVNFKEVNPTSGELLSTNGSMENLNWSLNLDKFQLIGFSKGCVVLNQFLHEFHHFKTQKPCDREALDFIDKIEEMYWLDGGHSGGKNTWITNLEILKCYADIGIKTFIHVTPYQVNDLKRPWIKEEEGIFYNILNNLGVNINRKLHYSNEDPNLLLHFSILNNFQKC